MASLEDDSHDDKAPRKKGALMPTLLALGVLTVLAGGAGALTGLLLADRTPAAAAAPAEAAAAPAEGEAAAGGHEAAEAGAAPAEGEGEAPKTLLLAMKPIVTNIAAPANVVVRLESSVLIKGETEEDPALIVARIEADTTTFLRTVQLAQLEGARGITHLREDLVERAKMRSPAVADVLIQTLVAE